MQNSQRTRRRLRSAARATGFGASLALLGGLVFPVGLIAAVAAPASAEITAPETGTSAQTDPAQPDSVPENSTVDTGAGAEEGSEASAGGGTEAPADTPTGAEVGEGTDVPGGTETTPAPGSGAGEDPAAPVVPGTDAVPIAPRSVPTAPAGSAVLSVKVGGNRLANGTVQGLAGVKLGLYNTGTATTGGGSGGAGILPVQGAAGTRVDASWPWTTCVSDADGDCNFIIPIRSGAASSTGTPQDSRFWVVQETSPTGWYANPQLRVGTFGATPEASWQYRFRTDTQLRAGTTYRSTTAMPWDTVAADPDRYFMRNRIDANTEDWYAANVSRTTGVWNQSRNNPELPAECGINIALIADTSGSLGATGIADMKAAMTSFVNAFRGTNTQMSLFSFSNETPGTGASNHPNLLPVTTAAQGAAFSAQYAAWASGGGTNWDRGIAEAANSGNAYDLAILLTDGNPTVIRGNTGAGSSAFNSLQDVDAGIFSANQLKALGTRLVALGVGPALTAASEANLRAVSGPTKNSDYYRTSSFTEATQALVALANKNCNGTIGVQKMIVPAGGTIAQATPAPEGWRFDASTTATAMTVQAPVTRTTATGDDGKVDFGLAFTAPTTTGPVQILETQQTGYELVPVGTGAAARNAVCVNTETGAPTAVTNAGTAAQPGFVVQGLRAQRVECKIYNRVLAPGKLEIAKSSNPPTGTTVKPGQSVTYTLTFKNTGELPVAVNHDDVLTDVLDDAVLTGTVTAQSPLTAALNGAGDRIRITGTLQPGTERTVSYTVTVRDPLPSAANASVRNYVVPTGEQPPTTCQPGEPCTVHPVVGGLTWNKVDQTGVRLGESEWLLTPVNAAGQPVPGSAITVTDCVAAAAASCTGADRDPTAGGFALRDLPMGKYQLRETKAPPGYQLLADPIAITINTNVAYGNIENRQVDVPAIPLTGGLGSFGFLLTGGGLGLSVIAGLWWQRRRKQVNAA
ncbi:SpaA isopeptide-forming pilin-related protein [Leucobacter luti]|uniref:DUF7927 domain-containing protein n=1 Tax=Leucobacter luti TaxID=340320 RepID=UPI001C691A6D|nr:SpaA isopeptide-forming pilin-related protein [Leucobacter luti]QYM74773.1 VWA domain-containing protein [Leucobacter luti]